MATATLNGGKRQAEATEQIEEKPKRAGNTMLKALEPKMYRSPYDLELINGRSVSSEDFCFEKAAKFLLEPLELQTEKECVDFIKGAYRWMGKAEERRQDEIVRDLLSRAAEDPKILEKLKEQLLGS